MCLLPVIMAYPEMRHILHGNDCEGCEEAYFFE